MKNVMVLFLVLFLETPVYTQAQQVNMTQLGLWFGKVPSYVMVNGHQSAPTATCADMLADPKLTIDNPGWKIDNYKIGIKPDDGNGDYSGPYSIKGAALTPQAIDAIKAQTGKKGIVQIESIQGTGPDGLRRNLAPIMINYTR